jgi:hypothetical protein
MRNDNGNSNLPALGGEFAHTFTKSSGEEGRGAGIIAIPFMAAAFLFFAALGFLMLLMGGLAFLAGKPGKVDFKYYVNKRPDFFGNKRQNGEFGARPENERIIDVEATEITDKEESGK